MNEAEDEKPEAAQSEVFGISAVSRLTGISPHVLRIWERRYQVVSPIRSRTQRREYSRDDVRRLGMVKALVDHGHSIRHVAGMDSESLEKLLEETQSDGVAPSGSTGTNEATVLPLKSATLVCVGTLVSEDLRKAAESEPRLEIVGNYADASALRASLKPGAADIVIVEIPTLFEEQVSEVQSLVQEIGARRAIVVYRFAQTKVVQSLDKDSRLITAMQSPVGAAELRLACIADLGPYPGDPAAQTASLESMEKALAESANGIPPRFFDDAQLARISRLSNAVQCECPQHLANLLSSLSAFESYSAECENRNEDDAQLHAYLHQTTAECRLAMELALRHLMEVENIALES